MNAYPEAGATLKSAEIGDDEKYRLEGHEIHTRRLVGDESLTLAILSCPHPPSALLVAQTLQETIFQVRMPILRGRGVRSGAR